jgi:hypothetical protein
MDLRRDDGMALLIALLALLLMTALGAALVLITSSESLIAGNFLFSLEALNAADAAIERANAELAGTADWNAVLNGTVRSLFADGPPGGSRSLADGSLVDPAEVASRANCGRSGSCSAAEMDAVTAERPWGTNNPRWQPYAYGWLRDTAPAGAIRSAFYVVVVVADDPAENDGNPVQDGAGAGNPGSGVILVRAEARGPGGSRRVVEATISRRPGPRLLTWREVR